MRPVSLLAPLLARVCRSHHWRRTGAHPSHIDEPLSDDGVHEHLNGGSPRGVCPITPGTSTTRCAVLDMDSHKGDVSWDTMRNFALMIMAALAECGLNAIPFRSSGGQGIHLVMLWAEPQDAYSVREALKIALGKCGLHSGTGGIVKSEVEIFPKQDSVPATGFGSMFILPLNGKSCALTQGLDDIPPTLIKWRASDPVTPYERPVIERSTVVPAELATLKSALDAIPNSGAQELDYDAWRNIVFATHSATAGSDAGLALAHELSARSSKYDPAFLDERVWPYVTSERPNAITVRTLYSMASGNGWNDPTVIDDFPVTAPASTVATTGAPLPDRPQDAGATRFTIYPFKEFIQRPAPAWIVEGVLPQAALAVVFGESGSGKTFFVLDIVGAVARAVAWREHAVLGGRVVYIAAEGAAGFRNRILAYARSHDLDDLDIGTITDAPNFMQADEIKGVLAKLHAYGKVDVIVVDTFAQVMPGANENAGEDVGKAIYHCAQIHRQTGALVVLIHHAGKDASKGARGWSGLRAAADVEIEITRNGDDRVAEVTKLKDGEDGDEFGFQLLVVPLEEKVSSCVVVEHGVTPKAHRRASKMTDGQAIAFDLICACIDVDGEGPLERKSVAELTALEHYKEHVPVGSGKDQRTRDFNREVRALVARNKLQVDGGRISRGPGA